MASLESFGDGDAQLAIDIAAHSDRGARADNQDDLRHAVLEPLAYAVLADGAGGHAQGEVASDLVVRLLALRLQSLPVPTPEQLSHHVEDAHQAVCQRQTAGGRRERMHATVVALVIDRQRSLALWSHVGDSRLYLLRHGRVLHVTRDDSVVRQMIDAGYLSEAEAAVHPQRHQLLAAMGIDGPLAPHTLAEPCALRDGDVLLLCSDGWWEDLGSDSLEAELAAAQNARDWLERLERRILAAQRVGQDNYSAVAIWLGDPRNVTRFGP